MGPPFSVGLVRLLTGSVAGTDGSAGALAGVGETKLDLATSSSLFFSSTLNLKGFLFSPFTGGGAGVEAKGAKEIGFVVSSTVFLGSSGAAGALVPNKNGAGAAALGASVDDAVVVAVPKVILGAASVLVGVAAAGAAAPNVIPAGAAVVELEAPPNCHPAGAGAPAAGAGALAPPNVNPLAPIDAVVEAAAPPILKPPAPMLPAGLGSSFLAAAAPSVPGLAVSQEGHASLSWSFRFAQEGHFHLVL